MIAAILLRRMRPTPLLRRMRPTRLFLTISIVTLSLLAASLVPLAARVAEASSGPVNQTYQLINLSSSMCLEVVGRSTDDDGVDGGVGGGGVEITPTDDGAYIQQWSCDRAATQAFVLEPVAQSPLGKYFRLVNQNSGKCLDVAGGSTADGANLQQLSCNGAANQTFSRVAQPGGGYRLAALHSGKCLDVESASTADGANVLQANCDFNQASLSQRFKMARSYVPGTGNIPTHSFKGFPLTDRAGIRVNLATGNLVFSNADLGGVARSWNSLSTDNSTELGYGWTLNLGRDTYLAADCSDIGPQASMQQLLKFDFTKQPDGSYTAPTGLDLDLARTSAAGTPCSAETWQVTSQFSRSSMSFGGPTGSRRYLTQMSDVNGNTVSISYDTASGVVRTTSITDSRGHTVTYLRSADGTQVAGLQDWGGRTESYQYDGAGRMVQAIDIAGNATTYGYDANNLVTSITDPNGNVTTIEYDSFRRVKVITQGGLRRAFGYDLDADGVCAESSITPPLTRTFVVGNGTATFCRDDEGRVRGTHDGHNERITYDYDVDSNMTKAGWLDSQASTTFDAQSRATSSTDATGATSSLGYADPANPYLPTAQTNPQGNTYGFGYDDRGQTTQITDPAANVQSYTYAADGKISTSTDQRGLVTAYGYDTAGRLTSMDPPGSALGTRTYTYDGLDRVASFTDGMGQQTTMSYDAMDRTARLSYADGSFASYSYDGNGNLASSQDASGTTSYTYDALNRLTTETAPGEATITYGYGLDGMLASYTDGGGTTQYEYGNALKLAKVTEPSGAVTTYQTETAPGNPRSFHPDFPVVTAYPNGVTVTQTPDLAGRVATMVATDPYGTTLFNRAYSYQDPDSGAMTDLLQSETDYNANTSTRYVYDVLDRLTQARTTELSTGSVSDHSYTYDAAGNRTSTTTNGSSVAETSNDSNQLTTRGSTTFGYDSNGNLTSSSAGSSAGYNAANQTTSITGNSGTTLSTSYTGVGQSRLAALGGQTITNSGLGITRVGGDRFTRGPDGRLVSMRTEEGDTYYYLTDTRGTVIGMVGPGEVTSFDPCMPDTTHVSAPDRSSVPEGVDGGVGEGEPCPVTDPAALTTFAYNDPFGSAGAASGNSPGAQRNPFRFTGALYSPELGLYKLGERWYDPALGRWTQADPLLQPYSPREANRYGYAAADPINLTDPSGLKTPAEHVRCVAGIGTLIAILAGLLGYGAGKLVLPGDPTIGAIIIGGLGPGVGTAVALFYCGAPPPPGGGGGQGPSPGPEPEPAPAPVEWPEWNWPSNEAIVGTGIGIGLAILAAILLGRSAGFMSGC